MQELKHQKTIRESLTMADLMQISDIESKFKGSICLIALVSKVSKSNVGYWPTNAILDDNFELSRNELGRLNTIPSVVGG